MNKHIFFVRADNDLDHFAPLIDFLLKDGCSVTLVSRDPMRDLSQDFRVQALFRSSTNFQFEEFIDLFGSRKQRDKKRRFSSIYWALAKRSASRYEFLGKVFGVVASLVLNKILFKLQADIEKKTDFSVIDNSLAVEDVASVSFDENFQPFSVGYAAHLTSKNVSVISLQHSIPHINSARIGTKFEINQAVYTKTVSDLNVFDAVIVPNEKVKERRENSGVDSSKLVNLGSLRFSPEGCEWVRDHLPLGFPVFKEAKKKVLLVASKIQTFIFKEEIFQIVRSIIRDDRFELVIKPHTRNGQTGFPNDILDNCFFAHSQPTSDLIEQSDLVMFWSSSVIYDALVTGKPSIFLKYVYSMPFDFKSYIDCWDIEDREDFSTFMNNFASGNDEYRAFLKEYDEQRARCNSALVLGKGPSVKQQYINFYRELAG